GVAKGKVIGRFEAALGIIGLLALGSAYVVVTGWNPLPAWQNWLAHSRIIADPAPSWTATADNEPSSAVVVRGVVVVGMDDEVAGYLASGGAKQWSRDVAWSAVAGSGLRAVVVAGRKRPLAGVRRMGRGDGVPPPVPPVLGFPLDDVVQVVSTADGARLHRYRSGSGSRIAVVGDRAVLTGGKYRSDGCRLHVEGRD